MYFFSPQETFGSILSIVTSSLPIQTIQTIATQRSTILRFGSRRSSTSLWDWVVSVFVVLGWWHRSCHQIHRVTSSTFCHEFLRSTSKTFHNVHWWVLTLYRLNWFEKVYLFASCIIGLVQERCNSSALAMELRLSCTYPLISSQLFCHLVKFLLEIGWQSPALLKSRYRVMTWASWLRKS